MGLRERKRADLLRHVQAVALDLFAAHGYRDVTMAQVAETAQVAERTVYRHFGTKDRLVTYDERDLAALETVAGRIAAVGLVAALREAVEVMSAGPSASEAESTRGRTQLQLLLEEPELRGAAFETTFQIGDELGALDARERGRPADDLECRARGRALSIAALTGAESWYRAGAHGSPTSAILIALDAVAPPEA